MLKQKNIIAFLIFLLFYIGNHGGSYYANHILLELGIVLTCGVFALLAWYSMFHIDQKTWKKWVFTSVGLTLFIALGWSIVFGVRFSQNILFSFFASRDYFFILLCPSIYLAWACGLDIVTIRRAILASLVLLMLNYLFFSTTMDLEAAFFSSNPKVSSLITADDWRGYRLKPPTYSIMVSLSFAIMIISGAVSRRHVLLAVTMLGLGIYIWTIIQARSTLATLILTYLLYPFFTYSYKRVPLLMACVPLGIIAIYILLQLLSSGDGVEADGADVRAYAFERAIDFIHTAPVWGAGQSSTYSLNWEQIMGPKFFPEDIGLIGMTFQYGFVGITLYLFMHFYILFKLWSTNWKYREVVGKHEPIVWGIFIWMGAQTLNIALNLGLATSQGMTVSGTGIALCAIYQKMLKTGELSKRRDKLKIF